MGWSNHGRENGTTVLSGERWESTVLWKETFLLNTFTGEVTSFIFFKSTSILKLLSFYFLIILKFISSTILAHVIQKASWNWSHSSSADFGVSLLKINSWMCKMVLAAQPVKNLPAMQETWVWSLGREDPPEKETAAHSSILAWGTPWTEGPGGLQSMGLQEWWET